MLVYSDDDRRPGSSRLRARRPHRAHRAAQVRALGHPVRNTILDLLHERAATVSELARALGRPKSTVAHHVKVLADGRPASRSCAHGACVRSRSGSTAARRGCSTCRSSGGRRARRCRGTSTTSRSPRGSRPGVPGREAVGLHPARANLRGTGVRVLGADGELVARVRPAAASGRRCTASRSACIRPTSRRCRWSTNRACQPPSTAVELAADDLETGAPDVLRDRRKDVVPDGGERASELLHARRPRHEPDVTVLAALTPAADVHVADARDLEDGALDLQQQRTQLGCAVVVEIGEVDVLARLEQNDDGEAARLVEWPNRPVLVRPQRRFVVIRAAPAVDTGGAISRPLGIDRRRQLANTKLSSRTATSPTRRWAERRARRACGPRTLPGSRARCDPTRPSMERWVTYSSQRSSLDRSCPIDPSTGSGVSKKGMEWRRFLLREISGGWSDKGWESCSRPRSSCLACSARLVSS